MEWIVKIIGEKSVLEELSKSLNSPEFCITKDVPQEGKTFILKSKHFNSLKEADEVRKKASEILSWISGCARLSIGLRKSLELGNVTESMKMENVRLSFLVRELSL